MPARAGSSRSARCGSAGAAPWASRRWCSPAPPWRPARCSGRFRCSPRVARSRRARSGAGIRCARSAAAATPRPRASKPSPTSRRPMSETRLRARDQFYISCFWFAYNFHWGALLAIVLPSQIAAIVGDARKELFNGLIPPLGAALSLVVTPLAGALSDRTHRRFGRRRPFMLVGVAINFVFLLVMGGFSQGSRVGLFLLLYLGVQLGNNWSGGPYAGLIPDVVPAEQRGTASGWLALMTALGT